MSGDGSVGVPISRTLASFTPETVHLYVILQFKNLYHCVLSWFLSPINSVILHKLINIKDSVFLPVKWPQEPHAPHGLDEILCV